MGGKMGYDLLTAQTISASFLRGPAFFSADDLTSQALVDAALRESPTSPQIALAAIPGSWSALSLFRRNGEMLALAAATLSSRPHRPSNIPSPFSFAGVAGVTASDSNPKTAPLGQTLELSPAEALTTISYGMVMRPDAEAEIVDGKWWPVLSEYLRIVSGAGETRATQSTRAAQAAQALLILDKSSSATPAQKILALRALAESLRRPTSFEEYLNSLSGLSEIFSREQGDPRIREIGLAIFNADVEGYSSAGSFLNFTHEELARAVLSNRTFVLGGPHWAAGIIKVTYEDLVRHRERINVIASRLFSLRYTPAPDPSFFKVNLTGPLSPAYIEWDSDFPRWFSALREIIGVSPITDGSLLLQKTRDVFSNEQELWLRRGLAMVYYSFLTHYSSRLLLSTEEATAVRLSLEKIVENSAEPVALRKVALNLLMDVFVNYFNANIANEGSLEREASRQWEDETITFVDRQAIRLGGFPHQVEDLRRMLEDSRRMTVVTSKPRGPSLWTRLKNFFGRS